MLSSGLLGSSGDDASPFIIRINVTTGSRWAPLAESRREPRMSNTEYKVYVWRSTTLQTVVQLLRLSNPVLSGPSSQHSFRLISYNQKEGVWQAEQVGSGICRADRSEVMRLLSGATKKALRESRAERGHGDRFSRAADDENDSEVDDDRRSCSTTIGDLGMRSDDLLECLIGPSDAYIGSVGQPVRNAMSHTAAERPYGTADRYAPQERSWSWSQRRDRPRSRSPPARTVRPW